MYFRAAHWGKFLLVWLVISLSACRPGSAAVSINPTQGAQMLAGKYTSVITADDVKQFGSLDDLSGNVGTWTFLLQPDGKYEADLNGNWMVDGGFTVTNTTIKIDIRNQCTDCGCGGDIGVYSWALAGDQLSFVKQAGSCEGMTLLLTAHPLTKAKE